MDWWWVCEEREGRDLQCARPPEEMKKPLLSYSKRFINMFNYRVVPAQRGCLLSCFILVVIDNRLAEYCIRRTDCCYYIKLVSVWSGMRLYCIPTAFSHNPTLQRQTNPLFLIVQDSTLIFPNFVCMYPSEVVLADNLASTLLCGPSGDRWPRCT